MQEIKNENAIIADKSALPTIESRKRALCRKQLRLLIRLGLKLIISVIGERLGVVG